MNWKRKPITGITFWFLMQVPNETGIILIIKNKKTNMSLATLESKRKPGNAMMSLNLYKTGETWMFDDDTYGIKAEPFVLGMSEIISAYLSKGKDRCTAIFSLNKFPLCDTLDLTKEDSNGGWYVVSESNFPTIRGMKGWLCPVTRVYLDTIPQNVYYKIEG